MSESISPPQPLPFLGLFVIVKDAADTIENLIKTVGWAGDPLTGGYAFDEYVFCDTGSTDGTRDLIVAKLLGGLQLALPTDEDSLTEQGPGRPRGQNARADGDRDVALADDGWPANDGEARELFAAAPGRTVRVVLAKFKWVDDFAAARNFCYSLGQSEWRMYLDSDDQTPDAAIIKKNLVEVAGRNKEANCVNVKYEYTASIGQVQDVPWRIVRWADGWQWFNALHEELRRFPAGNKRMIEWGDLIVLHRPAEGHHDKSLNRNIAISSKLYDEAVARNDKPNMGVYSYYVGEYLLAKGDPDASVKMMRQAANLLGFMNVAGMALQFAARIELERKNYDAAALLAGEAIARAPELQEPYGTLAIAAFHKGEIDRACQLFRRFTALGQQPLSSSREALWLEGIVPAYAAQAFFMLGLIDEGFLYLGKVRSDLARDNEMVTPLWRRAVERGMKLKARTVFQGLYEFLIWSDEALKAQALIETCAPNLIEGSPWLAEQRRNNDHRMRHMESWAAYQKCYGSLQADTYVPSSHSAQQIFAYGRAKRAMAYAGSLPKDGPPIHWLSIGPQDCNLEDGVMSQNDRIHMTLADASSLASQSTKWLSDKYPGRVTVHQIKWGHYDWSPRESSFDVISMFEVIEHVPSLEEALDHLYARLADDGKLFISTPVAWAWVNGELTKRDTLYDWWGHVRAHTPETLWQHLRAGGFDGTLSATETGSVFLAELHRPASGEYACAAFKEKVAIFVPSTPTPFGPFSHQRGHLGGSEEAVIHLAEALAKKYEVTVYAPPPPIENEVAVHAHNSVLWRDVVDFDFDSEEYKAVLFWRCPDLLALDMVKKPKKYKKLAWLHDTHYSCPAQAYNAADAVIVLSEAHAEALRVGDGYEGPVEIAGNGIDLAGFPELTEADEAARDPHAVIYASSPDRGLDRLLMMWPTIREQVPDATLEIFYSWDMLRAKAPAAVEVLENEVRRLAPLGVTYHGGVAHAELHRWMRKCGVWAYPTGFTETFAITAAKMQASGVWPVTTNIGALPETVLVATLDGWEGHIDAPEAELFIAAVVERLQTPPSVEARKDLSERARERFDWNTVAQDFIYYLIEDQ